jgi:hypothetical protein
MKLALLKVTVGAIVVQGLIENLLYANGTIHGENSGLRAYCKCLLWCCCCLDVEVLSLSSRRCAVLVGPGVVSVALGRE